MVQQSFMAEHLFKIYNYSIYVMWWWLSDPSPIIGKKLSLFKLWSQGFEVWGQDFEVKCGVGWLSVSVTVVWGRPNVTNRSQGREKQVLRKQCNNIIHDECNTLHCKHLYLTVRIWIITCKTNTQVLEKSAKSVRSGLVGAHIVINDIHEPFFF